MAHFRQGCLWWLHDLRHPHIPLITTGAALTTRTARTTALAASATLAALEATASVAPSTTTASQPLAATAGASKRLHRGT